MTLFIWKLQVMIAFIVVGLMLTVSSGKNSFIPGYSSTYAETIIRFMVHVFEECATADLSKSTD